MTRLAFLFQRYYDKTATPDEVDEFLCLADKEEHAAELHTLMEVAWQKAAAAEPVFSPAQSEALLKGVLEAGRVGALGAGPTGEGAGAGTGPDGTGERVIRLPWRRYAAAAAVVGILAGTGWWLMRQRSRPASMAVVTPNVARPVVPGRDKATLTLGDGSTIELDSAQQGTLAHQGGTEVVQVRGGHLAYTSGAGTAGAASGSAASGGAPVAYNTIKTPRGGQYQVVLPDGSKVWLNAASSLRFPTAFTGADRTVELTGEAYFDVATRAGQPFHVKVGDMQVAVLGTRFDVMAYPEEEGIRTSLLQGAVRVEGAGAPGEKLVPGQEALWNGQAFRVSEADTDQAVAWKNGLFQFDGATLEAVMRQVCRWYDVDVRYEGKVPRHFSGMISRSSPLTEVLRMLDLAGKARFTLEGRTVVVKAN